jgi:type IV pilus assembly protein PilP
MNRAYQLFTQWLCIISASGLLLACSGELITDLELYVEEVKGRQKTNIEPLPEFEPYESFIYQANDLRDPFTEPTFSQPRATTMQASGNGIAPDFNRPTEPLEEFTLDSLRMVGTLEQHEETWALINDTEGTIHRIQPGNYAGQNHGKISRITEYEVKLTEIIPDGIGGWVERQASITISE